MLVIISTILAIIALVVMAFIIVRRLPALALLDVENMPGEREARFKRKIIEERVERDMARWGGFFSRLWLRISKYISGLLKSRQTKLKRIKVHTRAQSKLPWRQKQAHIKELSASARELIKKEESALAEEKLLEIVSLDQKNLEAFVLLAGLYEDQRKWAESRQTYEYALKLARQRRGEDDGPREFSPQEIHYSLARMEQAADNLAAALENVREALEYEPNSPRFLDLILDLSIIRKDKNLAQASWEKMAAANPENSKLAEWQREIEALADPDS